MEIKTTQHWGKKNSNSENFKSKEDPCIQILLEEFGCENSTKKLLPEERSGTKE